MRFVFSREMDLEALISHRFPLEQVDRGFELAAHPKPDTMKIVIQPGSAWKESQSERTNDSRCPLRQRGREDRKGTHSTCWTKGKY